MKKFIIILFLIVRAAAQIPQPQIHLTGNLGTGGPSFAMLNSGNLVMASNANYTMAYPDMSAAFIRVTSSVTLTATRDIIAPVVRGFIFTIENATTGGQSIRIIGTSGTGVNISNGQTMVVSCDGTNYVMNGFGNRVHTAFGGGTEVDTAPTWKNLFTPPGGTAPATMWITEQVAPTNTSFFYLGLDIATNYVNTSGSLQSAYGSVSNPSLDTTSTAPMSLIAVGAYADEYTAAPTSSPGFVQAIDADCDHYGAMTLTNCWGMALGIFDVGTGPITDARAAYYVLNQDVGGGAITNAWGDYSQGKTNGTIGNYYQHYSELLNSAGTITNYYGNYVKAPVGAGTITHKYPFVSENGSGFFGINTVIPTHDLEVKGQVFSTTLESSVNGCINPLVDPYLVDNTCATDVHTSLQNAITAAANGCIILPIGCYKTSVALTLPNNISLMGTGSPFASETTSGVNQTVIEQTTNNIPVIDGSTATDFSIAHLWLKHTGTATSGGDGIKACITQVCATPNITDVWSAGNYIGFNLGPTNHAHFSNSAATNNKNHGIVITGTAISNALQWDLQTINATSNDGIGIVAISSAAAPQNATVGAWNQTSTFANTGGGIFLSGNATRSLSNVSIINCQGDEDGSDEIKIDTFGSKVTVGNCSLEGAGTTNTGSTGSTGASGVGYGVNITANNQGITLTGNTSSAMSQGGIINAGIGSSIVGNIDIANTGPGYANATGATHTSVSGNVFANNTTYGVFLSVAGVDCLSGNTFYGNTTADISGVPCFTGTSSSIGGGALIAGACASTTVSITGANNAQSVVATPTTYPGDGNYWFAYVSASNTVTVKVCATIAGTPTASTYNIRIIQ